MMGGPQSARNQIVRTSFQTINRYQLLDEPSEKHSRVNSKQTKEASINLTTNQQKCSLLGKLINAETDLIKGNRQSILNSIECESSSKLFKITTRRQLLAQKLKQNKPKITSSSKRKGVLPVKLRQELESGKLKIQSYDEYVIKHIAERQQARHLPSI